jgi:hypothetical protein
MLYLSTLLLNTILNLHRNLWTELTLQAGGLLYWIDDWGQYRQSLIHKDMSN